MDINYQALRVFCNYQLISYKKIWKIDKYIDLFEYLYVIILSKNLNDNHVISKIQNIYRDYKKKQFYISLWYKRFEYNKIRHTMFESWMYGCITLFNKTGRANLIETGPQIFYITLLKLQDQYDINSDDIYHIKNYKKITTKKSKNLNPYVNVFKWIKELIGKNWNNMQKYKNYQYHNPLTYKRSNNTIYLEKWDHEKYPLIYQKK